MKSFFSPFACVDSAPFLTENMPHVCDVTFDPFRETCADLGEGVTPSETRAQRLRGRRAEQEPSGWL